MPFDGVAGARWQIDIMAADKTAQAFGTVDRRLKSLEAGIAGLGRGMAAGMQQTVAFGRGLQQIAIGYGLVSAGQKAFQAGLRIGDLGEQAEQLGLNTDQLQAYRLMAAQAGVGVAQLDAALLKLQNAMGAANDGSDEMIARFEKLGVRILDASGNLRKPADVLPELSRGLLQVGSDTERTALMADLFGKSGARLKTMLEEWAQGNERLVASAKAQNAVAGPDAIKAWDELGDALKVTEQRYETMVGTLGKPVALVGLQAINFQLANINSLVNNIKAVWSSITTAAPLQQQVDRANDEITAFIQRGYTNDNPVLKDLIAKRDALLQQLNGQPAATMPTITVTADSGGASNPRGKTAAAAGAKLDERLKDLQAERAALEKALAAFDVRGLETVAEVDRRLDAQVKLDQKIASLLKDVPPNSPLAQQLIQEATSVSQLNARLDERKRILTEAEQVTARFGDGSLAAAREIERLNQMLAAGAIDAGTYERALKAATQAADDQARAARGASNGFDGFMAGVDQGMADAARANSAFELGRRGVDMLGESMDMLAGRSSRTFGQMAADFGMMLLKWEMAAQASNIWNSITGKGATNQGLFGSLLGGLGDLFGSGGWGIGATGGAYNGGGSMSYGGPRAAGGPVNPGSWYMVGEKGPEPFIPHTSGTILPTSALRGGATTVIVNVHNNGNNQVRTEESTGPGGMPKIDVFVDAIDGAFAKKLDRGVGPTSEVLKGRYGLQAVGRR